MIVPFHKQITDYSCGPAALQMVLEYFGVHASQEKLAARLDTDPVFGTSHREMIATARHHGFRCHAEIRSSVKRIEYFLARKLPVIVNFIEPVHDTSHYGVVVAASPDAIFLNDPENGRNFRIAKRDFEKRWHNNPNRSQGWLLVLMGKN